VQLAVGHLPAFSNCNCSALRASCPCAADFLFIRSMRIPLISGMPDAAPVQVEKCVAMASEDRTERSLPLVRSRRCRSSLFGRCRVQQMAGNGPALRLQSIACRVAEPLRMTTDSAARRLAQDVANVTLERARQNEP